jgi:hypothetical protein
MRKLVALAAVLALGALVAASALAQDLATTTVSGSAKVTPSKAGTPKHPQGVTLSGKFKWSSQEGVDPPVITDFNILIAKGAGVYNGGKYPKCSAAVANRGGPGACPKKSIMGSATGTAFADTTITRPTVTFINGGATSICAYTVLKNPARVATCVPIKIKKLSGDPKWGYRLTASVPTELQIVAGVPIALRDLTFTTGGKPWAEDYIATTGCPKSKKWEFQVETSYLYDLTNETSSSSFTDSVPCK